MWKVQIRCQNEYLSISLCTNGFKVFVGVFTDNPMNLLFNSLLSCPLFLKFSCVDHKNIASHPEGMGETTLEFWIIIETSGNIFIWQFELKSCYRHSIESGWIIASHFSFLSIVLAKYESEVLLSPLKAWHA